MTDILDRLLEQRNRLLIEDKPLPETIYLFRNEVLEINNKYLRHCAPGNTSEMKILGMRIIEI